MPRRHRPTAVDRRLAHCGGSRLPAAGTSLFALKSSPRGRRGGFCTEVVGGGGGGQQKRCPLMTAILRRDQLQGKPTPPKARLCDRPTPPPVVRDSGQPPMRCRACSGLAGAVACRPPTTVCRGGLCAGALSSAGRVPSDEGQCAATGPAQEAVASRDVSGRSAPDLIGSRPRSVVHSLH